MIEIKRVKETEERETERQHKRRQGCSSKVRRDYCAAVEAAAAAADTDAADIKHSL